MSQISFIILLCFILENSYKLRIEIYSIFFLCVASSVLNMTTFLHRLLKLKSFFFKNCLCECRQRYSQWLVLVRAIQLQKLLFKIFSGFCKSGRKFCAGLHLHTGAEIRERHPRGVLVKHTRHTGKINYSYVKPL